MRRSVLVLSCLAVLLAASAVQAAPVAYWAFLDVATSPTPNYGITWPLLASEKLRSGVARITTDATVWDGTTSGDATKQGAFQYYGGSSLEVQPGYLTAGGQGLSMRAIALPPSVYSSEGKSLTFQFDATACVGIQMIMAERYTSTGPNHVDVSWSINGSSFFFAEHYTPIVHSPAAFDSHTLDFSSVTALDNCDTAYVKLTFTGFSNNTGAVRLDNVRFTPEPASLGLLLIGGLLAFRRR